MGRIDDVNLFECANVFETELVCVAEPISIAQQSIDIRLRPLSKSMQAPSVQGHVKVRRLTS